MLLQGCVIETDRQGRELQAHGTGLLPIACYDEDIARSPVSWHWHDELEVGVVYSGEMLLSAGTQRLTIKTGDGFFVNAGVLHSGLPSGSGRVVLHSAVFHPRLVGGGADSIFWQKYLLPLIKNKGLEGLCLSSGGKWDTAIQNIEAAWNAAVAEDFGYEFVIRSALSDFILTLCLSTPATNAIPSEKTIRDNERIKCMLDYIQKHYLEKITIERIAASASVGKSECLRCFKSILNTTPIQYVKQYRLQRAAELLSTTDLKISDIGVACGFQEMSYFARAFREYKGCTPKDYQANHSAKHNQ